MAAELTAARRGAPASCCGGCRCTADYEDQIKGAYADIVNSAEDRKAGPIQAAEFLKRFAGDVPWAHLDIAGTAWDTGRPYIGKGGAGFGVRLLLEMARLQPA